ncbi:MAG: hypothetical protein JNK11_16230 [Alphaproteobacteria bacterium]|nr:hypothetical protein [Alphaproteobacteria bacterium]
MRAWVLSALIVAGAPTVATDVGACTARSGTDALGCRSLDVEITQVYAIAFTRSASERDCEDREFSSLYYGRKVACNVTARQVEILSCAPPRGLVSYLPSGEVQAAFCRVHKDEIAKLVGEPAPAMPIQTVVGGAPPAAPAQ